MVEVQVLATDLLEETQSWERTQYIKVDDLYALLSVDALLRPN